ncbi:MAG TPA: hypothetical protein VGH74_10595 [Planctomycetaceae bacterium]|jgi:hypothetical protein
MDNTEETEDVADGITTSKQIPKRLRRGWQGNPTDKLPDFDFYPWYCSAIRGHTFFDANRTEKSHGLNPARPLAGTKENEARSA